MSLSQPPATELSPSRSRALQLPDVLALVFRFLAKGNSVYPCLFVSRLWHSVAARVLWINLSFSQETEFKNFLHTTNERTTAVFPGYTRSIRIVQLKGSLTLPTFGADKAFTRLDRLEFFICHRLQLDSICTLIKQNPNLTQVRFPGCVQVDDEVLLLLARHCPSLEYLDLRACSNVTDRGIQAVARNCPSLSFLNVGRTSDGEHITDRSVMEIAANTNITTLGVSGCNVSDEGLLALIQHRKGQLERLSLNHCSSITDRSMAQLDTPTAAS
ncbi:RNI-like protein [Basidiobolus meristosporus CBS 931.73]|uniref:RNI-like protein n=1 Tax=Basidiobolus meristosporus CBS 931.73 TaxID=1314790 RepID=A0A1Y1XH01_9FUNG|nr:RNI-like protein [Basidiobolus meristosporus CBS 931.73]|eukprot:ORX85048.1 RNI-like protein [Basidiobolus meristosporus CBS 931.73]